MTSVSFEILDRPPRLEIREAVGNETVTLELEETTDLSAANPEEFPFPITTAIETEISGFELRTIAAMYLRDENGRLIDSIEPETTVYFPSDAYFLEICTPLKLYFRFTGAVSLEFTPDHMLIEFDEPLNVEIGSRSPRRRPSTEITVTKDPDDILIALSYLGEGILTTSPERAYPTLRRYPPTITIGEQLNIPDELDSNPQRTTIHLPSRIDRLFEAAPLAYYLNASLEPSTNPRVTVDGELLRSLDETTFARDAQRMLKHLFLMDCVIRSAGHYPIEIWEGDQLREAIPFEFSEAYRADLAERFKLYFQIPYETLEPYIPTWSAMATVEPKPANVTAIPHLAYQLTLIRTANPSRVTGDAARRAALTSFTTGGIGIRSAGEVFRGQAKFVETPPSEAITDVWVGEDIPLSANKLLVDGFQHRHTRPPRESTAIKVTLVCNEPWMDEEVKSAIDGYRDRESLPFTVNIHERLTRSELRSVLEAETDFFHYIGHATADGLECVDGYLDVATVSQVGTHTFLLNACQSYRQAIHLVENGCVGGIATLSDVTDSEAAVVGRTIARLMNLGFPLRIALEIARTRSIVGGQYLAVGDDSVLLVHSRSSIPYQCFITESSDAYKLTLRTFPTNRWGQGSQFAPLLRSQTKRYLLGNDIGPLTVSADELVKFLEHENAPVEFEGEFRWAMDLAHEIEVHD